MTNSSTMPAGPDDEAGMPRVAPDRGAPPLRGILAGLDVVGCAAHVLRSLGSISAVEEVEHRVEQHDSRRQHQHARLHQLVVAREDGLEDGRADAPAG